MPQTFAHNRDALHSIAEQIVSPARVAGRRVTSTTRSPTCTSGPWTKPEWNAVGFHGAEAPRTGEAAALAFFRDRRDALHP